MYKLISENTLSRILLDRVARLSVAKARILLSLAVCLQRDATVQSTLVIMTLFALQSHVSGRKD